MGLRLETARVFIGVVTSTLLLDGCFGHALCALCVLLAVIVCATFPVAGFLSIFHLKYLSTLMVPITGIALHLLQQEAEDTRVMLNRNRNFSRATRELQDRSIRECRYSRSQRAIRIRTDGL